jgi:hypothetical protein
MRVDAASVVLEGDTLTARAASAVAGSPPFALTLRFLDTGAVRMRLLEATDAPPRWEVRARARPQAAGVQRGGRARPPHSLSSSSLALRSLPMWS